MKSIFEGVANYLDGLVALAEQIPRKNLEAAMSCKTKGSTLILVKKRELDEIKENLQEVANLLSKPNA